MTFPQRNLGKSRKSQNSPANETISPVDATRQTNFHQAQASAFVNHAAYACPSASLLPACRNTLFPRNATSFCGVSAGEHRFRRASRSLHDRRLISAWPKSQPCLVELVDTATKEHDDFGESQKSPRTSELRGFTNELPLLTGLKWKLFY